MASDNHLFSVTCYNVTMQKQDYYSEFFEIGQQKINFRFFELCLPDIPLILCMQDTIPFYMKWIMDRNTILEMSRCSS